MTDWQGHSLEVALQRFRDAMPPEWATQTDPLPPCRPIPHTDEEIAAANARLKKPMPREIEAMYRAIAGVPGIEPPSSPDRATDTFVYALGDANWHDIYDMMEPDVQEEIDHYFGMDCELFLFAQTIYGDEIYYCVSANRLAPGGIYANDHECGAQNPNQLYENSYTQVVKLADSLDDWLGRFAAAGFDEYIFGGFPGGTDELQIALLEDYIRLNPFLVRHREQLARLRANG